MLGRKYVRVLSVLVILGVLGVIGFQVFWPWVFDYREYRYIARLAESGDPGYQRLLAEYLYDKGDFDSALIWEMKAASAGDTLAQDFMGSYFRYGINDQLRPAALDYGRAREWFEKAAAEDFQPSQAELCEMYFSGLGVAQDQEVAYFWCSLSESYDRAAKFKELSRDALDPQDQQRAELRVAKWINANRKSR